VGHRAPHRVQTSKVAFYNIQEGNVVILISVPDTRDMNIMENGQVCSLDRFLIESGMSRKL
jgi:hypothetical protein